LLARYQSNTVVSYFLTYPLINYINYTKKYSHNSSRCPCEHK
jgi:hypothetical protein